MTTTRIAVGLGEHADGYRTGQMVARAALDDLNGATPALALLFTSHADPQGVLRGVNATLPEVPLIGGTSAGEYTAAGYVEGGAGLMLIASEAIQFHPLFHKRTWLRRGRRLLGRLVGTSEAGLGGPHHHRALVLFPDDESMSLDGVVERAMTETGMLYDILGGPALPHPPRPPTVFFNDRLMQAGLSGAEILSTQPVGLALANGWQPTSGPYRVTAVEPGRILTIDGRPAQEVYEDFLAARGLALNRETLAAHPVGVCAATCKVSVVLKGFDADGALLVTSPPPAGSRLHILSTERDAMITAAVRAIQGAGQAMEQPAGALFIDCMSTSVVLAESYQAQRAAVQQQLGAVPFLGFRSHGVLVRLPGQTNGHFECSVAACMLPV